MSTTASITAARQLTGTATDATVTRFRMLKMVAEKGATQGYVNDRALFEARIRKAKGDEVTVTVQGWRQPKPSDTQGNFTGALWQINQQVYIQSLTARVGGWYLVTEVEFMLSNDEGTVTKLVCKRPDAYLAALNETEEDNLVKETYNAARAAKRQAVRSKASHQKALQNAANFNAQVNQAATKALQNERQSN